MATGLDVNSYSSRCTPWSHLLDRCAGNCRFALVTLFCLSVSSCGIYSAGEITATVVDSDTNVPLEGVNVVAAWKVRGGVNFGATVGYINVMETISGKDGKFHFPKWGPRPNLHVGEIRQEAPVLMLFKSGYRYSVVENNSSSIAPAPGAMKSDWNGALIPMKRYLGHTPDYEAGFIPLITDIENLKRYGRWNDIAGLLCAMAREHEYLSAHGIGNTLYPFKALNDAGVDCRNKGAAS